MTSSNMNKKYKLAIVAAVIVFTIITCINPVYPEEQYLQHIGTALLVLLMLFDIRKNFLGKVSFIGLALFTALHIIGARYIYSYVPYDEFAQRLCGVSINELLGTTRNHYDRFVHFSFGLLMMPMFSQVAEKKMKCTKGIAIVVAWMLIQTGSMIYELFEWLLTIVMSPEAADNYNGQQGDMWDAQKDMALALLGSSVTATLMLITKKQQKP